MLTRISVIIATKNEEKNIERCLNSLKNQTFQEFEIIVVDNHSSDKTGQIASKFADKIYIRGPERSAQRNFGLKKATGKYILFVDADMELETSLLGECLKVMSDPKICGVVMDEVSVGESFLTKIKALEKQFYTGREEMEAARFFRKKDLIKISGYDENLIAGEDWDLSQRMQKLGKLARIHAKIRHREDKTFWQDIKKKYYYCLYIARYAQKHPKMFQLQFSPFSRLKIILSRPRLILTHPLEFLGLIILKSAHYLAYLWAKFANY